MNIQNIALRLKIDNIEKKNDVQSNILSQSDGVRKEEDSRESINTKMEVERVVYMEKSAANSKNTIQNFYTLRPSGAAVTLMHNQPKWFQRRYKRFSTHQYSTFILNNNVDIPS